MRRTSAKSGSAVLLRRSAAAAKLGNSILGAPNRIVTTAIQAFFGLSAFGLQAAILVALLLLLFVVHSLFVWDERSPEQAFDRSAQLVEAVELGYDTSTILLNAVTDVFNVVIPGYNAAVFYAVEPSVFLLLEAFSIVFEGHEYEGVLEQSSFEYRGLDCLSTPESARFCGRYQAYENLLIQNEQGFMNESQVFLGLSTARRLSELNGAFTVPVFDLSIVTDVLTSVLTLGITSLAPLADIIASVLDDVIETSAKTVFDSLWFLAENLVMTLKMLVKSGLLTFLVTVGVDFAIIYYVFYALPMFLALIDFINCVLQLILPATWDEQLRCAETTCFQGPDAASDLLIFTSYSTFTRLASDALEAMTNGATAQTFGSGAETGALGGFLGGGVVGIASVLREIAGAFDVPASAENCAACFKCRFPEMRAIWLIVASVFSIGSPSSYRRFSGNVTEHCGDNSSFYQTVCGPRGVELNFVTWKSAFRTGWDPYDPGLIEEYAGLFAKRADELGGASSYAGGLLQLAADSWFLRDITTGEEEAAPFVYHACKLMRGSDGGEDTDIGPGFSNYPQGSLSHVSGGFLYSLCKRFRHTTVGFGRDIHDVLHEALACVGDPVGCKKDMERCIGVCGVTDSSNLLHDFATVVALAELSDEVLGEGGAEAAHANCSKKTATVLVDFFEGGDSFRTFAGRLRVRSGMTAIDTEWCQNSPISCGTVQRVLERTPGLVWANGQFRHAFDLESPHPPPPPRPPPGFNYGPAPPPPPNPPPPPPPYHQLAEPCIPLPSLQTAGPGVARERVNAAPHEERSACLMVKRILDVRRKASSCFSALASPNPPPPPGAEVFSREDELAQWRARVARGENAPYPQPVATDPEAYQERATNAIVEVEELVRELGETQPMLRGILDGAVEELQLAIQDSKTDAQGRRLLQRETDYHTHLKDALSQHPVQATVGISGIPGLTVLSCEALCDAVSRDRNATNLQRCEAYAFRRDHPDLATDLTGHCWLLTSAGTCKPIDFAAQLYVRNVDSESICDATRPGKDNEVCLGLPATSRETLVMTHGDAAAVAAQLPAQSAPGAGGLPIPRSTLEAMLFIAYARQAGIEAFWSGTPDTSAGPVTLPWITDGGKQLVFNQGETRCILVGAGFGKAERMYAMLRPCNSKQASGIVTVAASAAPPPPPGSTARGYFDPAVAPPPPPDIETAAWDVWKKREVLPRTEALCTGGLEGRRHESLCLEMAQSLGSWQPVAGIGLRAPLCRSHNCWKRCEADHVGADTDSFHTCKSLGCASSPCMDFLLETCPQVVHSKIQGIYDAACTITPPSPPMPPHSPPSPPSPPGSPPPKPPPPFIGGSTRESAFELDWEADCELVSFQQCRMKVQQFSQANPGHIDALRATVAPCEGGESDQTCFQGCQFGGRVRRFPAPAPPLNLPTP